MDENVRQKMDYYRGGHNPWNMMPQHTTKEANALTMNKKIMSILKDTETAIQERNEAMAETKEAVQARDEALKQRDEAVAERDKALMERNNAREALQYWENAVSFQQLSGGGGPRSDRGIKRVPHPTAACHHNENGSSKMAKKGKIMSEDVKVQAAYSSSSSDGVKFKSEWDIQEVGLNLIAFDDSTMPVPVCSCTGVSRACYRWGSGGWQSSCCTTTMSMFPLPQMPNRRHARVGGRKMSGNVFTRLLTRMAKAGHDLSVPVDLKDYWARHGTNRYIIIK